MPRSQGSQQVGTSPSQALSPSHHNLHPVPISPPLQALSFTSISFLSPSPCFSIGMARVLALSGDEVDDVSINYAFSKVQEIAPTPFIGFANSDILFNDDLLLSLDAVLKQWPIVKSSLHHSNQTCPTSFVFEPPTHCHAIEKHSIDRSSPTSSNAHLHVFRLISGALEEYLHRRGSN